MSKDPLSREEMSISMGEGVAGSQPPNPCRTLATRTWKELYPKLNIIVYSAKMTNFLSRKTVTKKNVQYLGKILLKEVAMSIQISLLNQ